MQFENSVIEWKQKYNLGIEDIDFQHHFFLNLINRLAKELLSSNNAEYQFSLIAELNAYACFHFISEENMMFRAGYPELETHKKQHLEIIEKLSVEGNRFRLNPSQKELERIISLLTNWFLTHTSQEDKLFANYFHRKNNISKV